MELPTLAVFQSVTASVFTSAAISPNMQSYYASLMRRRHRSRRMAQALHTDSYIVRCSSVMPRILCEHARDDLRVRMLAGDLAIRESMVL